MGTTGKTLNRLTFDQRRQLHDYCLNQRDTIEAEKLSRGEIAGRFSLQANCKITIANVQGVTKGLRIKWGREKKPTNGNGVHPETLFDVDDKPALQDFLSELYASHLDFLEQFGHNVTPECHRAAVRLGVAE